MLTIAADIPIEKTAPIKTTADSKFMFGFITASETKKIFKDLPKSAPTLTQKLK